MTTEQLKPCPFCKEDMAMVESGIGHVFVHTAGNDCWLRSVTIFPHEFEAWNRRTPVELSAQTAVKTEQPSLSNAQLEEIASWLDEASDDIDSWGGYASDYFAEKWNLSGAIQSYKDRATKVRALLSAQRQDSDKDAERYRKAIAYEDNAGLLYCAVMNHCPDKAAIDAEFDAEAIDIAIANGAQT